tara:strand:- start:1913 stop:2086 length:174 start_codon:yes stop_codon:yes gene_type:complete
MKKPYYNNFERQIILEDNSLSASIMKLNIALNSFLKRFFSPVITLLYKITTTSKQMD